ncbi:MAG: hypothetical protein R2779_08370 [Crocinitomicaceae bacterium]
MHKDIDRLNKVTDRFSKIGSEAKMESMNLSVTVQEIIDYLQVEHQKQVQFTSKLKKMYGSPQFFVDFG